MSTVEFHPWNSRRADPPESPDEWRIDLDPPMPDCTFSRIQRVSHVVEEVLDELGMRGFPKTSGGRGLHIYVRIEPEWGGFPQVRRAALAFAREVERRAPKDVTTTWWRKDRNPAAVFVDYNQNTRDHTMASAYSVRGNQRATVSTPIRWDEIDDIEPDDFTIATVPARFAELGGICTPRSTMSPTASTPCSNGPTGRTSERTRTRPSTSMRGDIRWSPAFRGSSLSLLAPQGAGTRPRTSTRPDDLQRDVRRRLIAEGAEVLIRAREPEAGEPGAGGVVSGRMHSTVRSAASSSATVAKPLT